MTDSKVKIAGFDTEPGKLDAFAETSREQAERLAQEAVTSRSDSEHSRKVNDEVVNKRLFALRDQVTALHGRIGTLDVKVDGQQIKMDVVEIKLDKNNDMTKQVLEILGGGKMIVNLIKLCGVLAVPIAAIATAIHVFTGKGP